MGWKLWLDDQLDDPETPNRHVPNGFVGAKSSQAACYEIGFYSYAGPPEFMDLDHDLGGHDTAMEFLKFLQVLLDKTQEPIPEYKVHSANPVGRDNIISFMESWKKSRSM